MPMKIMHIVGARPNFIKAAAVYLALRQHGAFVQQLVHTGQHYDANMSDVFFQELGLTAPDVNLEVGSGTHAQQTAAIMLALEPLVQQQQPDVVLVYGDVNSTVAAALVCAKLLVPLGHVEAGLRSFDRTMPEEINRLLTDQIADMLFTPSADADRNLEREGIAPEKVHLVGNVMIDTLVRMLPAARSAPKPALPTPYALVTLHRPSNVDDLPWLEQMLVMLESISRDLAVVFPVHPRTRERLGKRQTALRGNLLLMEPMPYLSFLALQLEATAVITDSGGIQEEATFLGVPCLTVRENTERPITIEQGTNILVGRNPARLRTELEQILLGHRKPHRVPPFWDGHAAERIVEVIAARKSMAGVSA